NPIISGYISAKVKLGNSSQSIYWDAVTENFNIDLKIPDLSYGDNLSLEIINFTYGINFIVDWYLGYVPTWLFKFVIGEGDEFHLIQYPNINFDLAPILGNITLNTWNAYTNTWKRPGAPSTPLLTITTPSPTSSPDISLEWTPSVGTDNYTLYRHTTPITSSNLISTTKIKTIMGASTSDTVSGLGRWYYAITANNESGSSDPSNSPYIDVVGPSNMDFAWNRTWGTVDGDFAEDIACDSEGNIYIVGWTNNDTAGGYDILLIKYNNLGIQIWNRTWGGVGTDYGYGIAIDSSNNIFVVGQFLNSSTSHLDVALVKYDSLGTQIWNRTWDQTNTENEVGYGVAIDNNDNIYITGYAYIPGLDKQALLVKYDETGHYQWKVTWGGTEIEEAYSVAVDSQNNVYITGTTGSEFQTFLINYNSAGVEQWARTERDWASGGGN
ncbi:unnamed protein product, partial [marine sediment metagenome]